MRAGFHPADMKADPPTAGQHWVEVTKGGSGWFAVEMWINPGEEPGLYSGEPLGPFPEPWDSGPSRFSTEAEACIEAYIMAQTLDVPYRLRYTPGTPEYSTALRAMVSR
jgi:hypothetical protein